MPTLFMEIKIIAH